MCGSDAAGNLWLEAWSISIPFELPVWHQKGDVPSDALTWRYTVVSPKVGCHGITCWRSEFSLHQIRVAIVGYPSMF